MSWEGSGWQPRNLKKAKAEGNLVRLAETDVAFHEIIYQASDNKRLNQVLNNLREQMYRYRVEYLKEEQTRNLLVSEHEELVKAIREGDVQKAQDISFPSSGKSAKSDHPYYPRGE